MSSSKSKARVSDHRIPNFYCTYLLQSSVRRNSLYIGSTPDPKRRLKQHNGQVKGGASRTSRDKLRPWEMVFIVTGFPSRVAALQFEWHWQNPHTSTKIPDEQRISLNQPVKRVSRRTGRTYTKAVRPNLSVSSALKNALLLLHVDSFVRWPLAVSIFRKEVYDVWCKVIKEQPITRPLGVKYDPKARISADDEAISLASLVGKPKDLEGIHKIDISSEPYRDHIVKTSTLLSLGNAICNICNKPLSRSDPYILSCPHKSCDGLSHMQCLADEFLSQESLKRPRDDDIIFAAVPVSGRCPSCLKPANWIDYVKEQGLRTKEDVLDKNGEWKEKKRRKAKIIPDSQDEMSDDDLIILEEASEDDDKADDSFDENWEKTIHSATGSSSGNEAS